MSRSDEPPSAPRLFLATVLGLPAVIVVMEPVRRGPEHEAFNASLLLACRQAFPDDAIVFYAEAQHLRAVRRLAGTAVAVEFRPLQVAARHAGALARAFRDRRAAALAMDVADREAARLMIFASVTSPLIRRLRQLCGKRCPVPVFGVVHAGLSAVLRQPRFNLLKRRRSLRQAMLSAPPGMQFLVLEASILETVRERAPALAARLAVFEHPLPPDLLNRPLRGDDRAGPPVRIGLLGLCTPQKGLNVFLELAAGVGERRRGQLEFSIVGRIHEQSVERSRPYLRYLARTPSATVLPRDEFVRETAALHYAAFFFEGSHYRSTASGVLLDCIALGIPLVGRRHPLFDALTAKVGEIGEFCEPGGEAAMLERLAESFDPLHYANQRRNMLALRDERTPAALGRRLRALYEASAGK